jgi:hypothetical protein
MIIKNRNGSVGIVARLRDVRPWFSSRQGQGFFVVFRVKTGCEAHPAFYPMVTGGFFSAGKAALA